MKIKNTMRHLALKGKVFVKHLDIKSNSSFYSGIAILIILTITYFIKVPTSVTTSSITYSPILAILIFHNPFILIIYFIITIALILKGIGKIKFT